MLRLDRGRDSERPSVDTRQEVELHHYRTAVPAFVLDTPWGGLQIRRATLAFLAMASAEADFRLVPVRAPRTSGGSGEFLCPYTGFQVGQIHGLPGHRVGEGPSCPIGPRQRSLVSAVPATDVPGRIRVRQRTAFGAEHGCSLCRVFFNDSTIH
jgi:hypothetical protein